MAGSVWRSALLASAKAQFGKGNDLSGLEETGEALRECWPWLCVLLAFSVLLAVGIDYGLGRAGDVAGFKFWRWGFLGVAVVWVLLFVHNAFLLPKSIGFDASAPSRVPQSIMFKITSACRRRKRDGRCFRDRFIMFCRRACFGLGI